jgi:hypothetical protein
MACVNPLSLAAFRLGLAQSFSSFFFFKHYPEPLLHEQYEIISRWVYDTEARFITIVQRDSSPGTRTF